MVSRDSFEQLNKQLNDKLDKICDLNDQLEQLACMLEHAETSQEKETIRARLQEMEKERVKAHKFID